MSRASPGLSPSDRGPFRTPMGVEVSAVEVVVDAELILIDLATPIVPAPDRHVTGAAPIPQPSPATFAVSAK